MVNTRIVMIGDYNAGKTSHQADKLVAEQTDHFENSTVWWDWIETSDLAEDIYDQLSIYQGIWCVPGSPYENMEGVLSAIRFARESRIPFLGTCGGFQHAVIEYARNVLGIDNADHAESNPEADDPLIELLECSLVDKTASISLTPRTKLAHIMQREKIEETYHCRYGINRKYENLFSMEDMLIAGTDAAGEIRAIELSDHPFFICTLFQIERSALKAERHPLIDAFLHAAVVKGRRES